MQLVSKLRAKNLWQAIILVELCASQTIYQQHLTYIFRNTANKENWRGDKNLF